MMKTSLYTILCTAIRLGAVWLGVNVLIGFPWIYEFAVKGTYGPKPALVVFVWNGVAFLAAFLLWLYPGLLARLAAGKSSGQVFESPLSAQQIEQAALVVLGMWFVMTGLINLTHEVLRSLLEWQQLQIGFGATVEQHIDRLLTPVIQVGVGGVLTFGSRGLVSLIHRAREAALSRAVADDEPEIQGSDKS